MHTTEDAGKNPAKERVMSTFERAHVSLNGGLFFYLVIAIVIPFCANGRSFYHVCSQIYSSDEYVPKYHSSSRTRVTLRIIE